MSFSVDFITAVWLSALTLYMVGVRGRVLRLERRQADEMRALNQLIAELERARWSLNNNVTELLRRLGGDVP
jgi:hypothetical protein